jgi:hypothetical protein
MSNAPNTAAEAQSVLSGPRRASVPPLDDPIDSGSHDVNTSTRHTAIRDGSTEKGTEEEGVEDSEDSSLTSLEELEERADSAAVEGEEDTSRETIASGESSGKKGKSEGESRATVREQTKRPLQESTSQFSLSLL